MEHLLAWMGAALAAALFALILQKDSPVLAFAVALTGILYLLWGMIAPASELVHAVRGMLDVLEGTQTIYIPVIKAVCIAVVVRLTGAVCQDAGQTALAAQLELAGTAAAIVVCIPLLEEVLNLVSRMIA